MSIPMWRIVAAAIPVPLPSIDCIPGADPTAAHRQNTEQTQGLMQDPVTMVVGPEFRPLTALSTGLVRDVGELCQLCPRGGTYSIHNNADPPRTADFR
ncbi:hypothetical protein GFY24_04680 [Nocardia sp. SYP-A9097]|uniref:hypothetical protein n=1 Tax=Nocardia sp. SYP-A9097 TaxID=2663237 RepID=UPI00129BAD33|nr:hypothetical protein [Nocardia sp. SYP-A9097]MRH86771.1 hypothetical protein [Nocardia sp. SYP-A9097]